MALVSNNQYVFNMLVFYACVMYISVSASDLHFCHPLIIWQLSLWYDIIWIYSYLKIKLNFCLCGGHLRKKYKLSITNKSIKSNWNGKILLHHQHMIYRIKQLFRFQVNEYKNWSSCRITYSVPEWLLQLLIFFYTGQISSKTFRKS